MELEPGKAFTFSSRFALKGLVVDQEHRAALSAGLLKAAVVHSEHSALDMPGHLTV